MVHVSPGSNRLQQGWVPRHAYHLRRSVNFLTKCRQRLYKEGDCMLPVTQPEITGTTLTECPKDGSEARADHGSHSRVSHRSKNKTSSQPEDTSTEPLEQYVAHHLVTNVQWLVR
jgi:hypothetical protein